MADQRTLSKSAFATLRGVNPSQVTRWIEAGYIDRSAMVGQGRTARIVVHLAIAQLDKRRDPGQALGNGARPKLDRPLAVPLATRKATPPRPQSEPEAAESGADDLGDPGPDDLDYAAERARLARAQADAQEMKNALARGEMEHADAIRQRWSEIALRFRSCMLAVPGRIRDAAPHLTPSDLALIDAEIRRALKDASLGPSS